MGIKTLDMDFSVHNGSNYNLYTNTYTIHLPSGISYTEIVERLSEYENVMSVRTTNT